MVSMFLGFLVSEFIGFLVSKFLVFKVSKIYHIPISCFLEGIDPTSKIFSRDCSALVFSNKIIIWDFQNFEIYKTHMFKHVLMFSLIMWRILVSPKIEIVAFGRPGHVQKARNHRNEGSRSLP